MGQIITICNPKGGTAKTSTAINLACAMRAVNKKVLLVDFDPQGSASCALGFMQTDIECNLATAILDNVNIENCIVPYLKGGFDVILSSDELVAVPPALNDDPNAHLCLYNLLYPLKDRYDLIIVDTPASLNLLTKAAICASDFIISTVSLDILSVDSMASLMNFYEKLKSNGMTGAIVLGLLRTMYEPLHKMCDVISNELEHSFTDLIFKTKISYNPKVSEASSAACPVLLYDRSSKVSREYLSFCAEVIKRLLKWQKIAEN